MKQKPYLIFITTVITMCYLSFLICPWEIQYEKLFCLIDGKVDWMVRSQTQVSWPHNPWIQYPWVYRPKECSEILNFYVLIQEYPHPFVRHLRRGCHKLPSSQPATEHPRKVSETLQASHFSLQRDPSPSSRIPPASLHWGLAHCFSVPHGDSVENPAH